MTDQQLEQMKRDFRNSEDIGMLRNHGLRLARELKRMQRRVQFEETGHMHIDTAECPHCMKRECECSEFDVASDMGARG